METINKMELITRLGDKFFELNAKLSQKKNKLRGMLKEKGVLQKDKENAYDNYKYFSEAGYKQLFTELFAVAGLELTCDEREYETYTTTSEKQPNGRIVKLVFTLTDTETGFFEQSEISGEGIDKGDKAGYKAYTGALKYYLANTFMVATGDDAENESPEAKGGKKKADKTTEEKASPKQISILEKFYTGENLAKLLEVNGIDKLEDLSIQKASELITKIYKKRGDKQ